MNKAHEFIRGKNRKKIGTVSTVYLLTKRIDKPLKRLKNDSVLFPRINSWALSIFFKRTFGAK